MKEIENKLGYKFKNSSLLETALTHSSYANEKFHNKVECNERLEFLGDAILDFIVGEDLYIQNPKMTEGAMTQLRSQLVCEDALSSIASYIGLGKYLLLGKGEDQTGGRTRKSINADAVEAIIAAVYLDGGFEESRQLVHRLVLSGIIDNTNMDYKTQLQELVQMTPGKEIVYELTGTNGPDHMKIFEMSVKVDNQVIGIGSGTTKKRAEQEAAKAALEAMKK